MVAAVPAAQLRQLPRHANTMTTILIVDDHPLYRLALAQALRGVIADMTVLEAGSLTEARAHLGGSADIDLVLLDLHMPDSHGLAGLVAIRTEHPQVAVAMISAHDDPATIRRALTYGASAFIAKRSSVEELQAALTALLAGNDYLPPALREPVRATTADASDVDVAARLASLSPQQFRVLLQVAEGRLNKQIADALAISERTVKAHLTALFEKLGVSNRTQAGVLLRSLELRDPARDVAS